MDLLIAVQQFMLQNKTSVQLTSLGERIHALEHPVQECLKIASTQKDKAY